MRRGPATAVIVIIGTLMVLEHFISMGQQLLYLIGCAGMLAVIGWILLPPIIHDRRRQRATVERATALVATLGGRVGKPEDRLAGVPIQQADGRRIIVYGETVSCHRPVPSSVPSFVLMGESAAGSREAEDFGLYKNGLVYDATSTRVVHGAQATTLMMHSPADLVSRLNALGEPSIRRGPDALVIETVTAEPEAIREAFGLLDAVCLNLELNPVDT